jgi:transportin-1
VAQRALQLSRRALTLRDQQEANPDVEVGYEPDHVVCTLDLISGIADGVAEGAAVLVSADPDGTREVILKAITDLRSPGIRRSGFALIGDIAKAPNAVGHLLPILPRIIQSAVTQLDPTMVQAYNMGACNNACWSTGEMAMAFDMAQIGPHASVLVNAFQRVLSQTMVHRSLGENAAISLGRFALRCPESISQSFETLVTPWCGALRRLRDGVEKEQAFGGLVRLVQLNPAGGVNGLIPMLHAIASWQKVRDVSLHGNLLQLMQGYETLVGPQKWTEVIQNLGPAATKKLGGFAQNVGA